MQIYIARGNQRSGPFNLSQVQAHLDAGTILPTDWAWHQGLKRWCEVSQLEGIKFSGRHMLPVLAASRERESMGPSRVWQPSGELVILVLLSIFVPLIGVIIGLLRLSKRGRRGEALLLLGISFSLMALYTVLLFFMVV